jgi:hypothetical protein
LGGTELTEEIVSRLTDQLKIQFSLMKPQVSGIEEAKLQEYLVPLSMQFAEPAEPSDPKSLNLLPNSLVDKYKRERLRLQVWGLTLTITLFTSISFLVTLGTYLFMVQNINNLKEGGGVNQEFAEMRKELLNNVKAINKVSDRILDIKKVSVLPQQILNTIQSAKPQGVTIQSYTLDLDRGQVSVTGISSNRNSLIEFKERLEADSDYVNVTIPISNFEQEVNLEFTLSFQYKPVVPTPTPVKKRATPTT